MNKTIALGFIALDTLFLLSLSPVLAQRTQRMGETLEYAALQTAKRRIEKGSKVRVVAITIFDVRQKSSANVIKSKSSVTAQATSTRKIVVPKLGYSFDVPSWARVINNRNSLEILTQKNFDFRQSGKSDCNFQTGSTAGCADIDIGIQENGRQQLVEAHKEFVNITGPGAYKGKITINGRTYRKYEAKDENGTRNAYLYLTKDNRLISIYLSREHYQGNKDALVTVLGSFKE